MLKELRANAQVSTHAGGRTLVGEHRRTRRDPCEVCQRDARPQRRAGALRVTGESIRSARGARTWGSWAEDAIGRGLKVAPKPRGRLRREGGALPPGGGFAQ